jgi:hypothetical protein
MNRSVAAAAASECVCPIFRSKSWQQKAKLGDWGGVSQWRKLETAGEVRRFGWARTTIPGQRVRVIVVTNPLTSLEGE